MVNEQSIASGAMAVASALVAGSIASGNPFLEFYSVIAMFLAGSLMGEARQAKNK